MAYELKGKIKLISDTQTFSSGFSKREFVVTTQEGKYPQDIKLECLKEKADQLENFKEGDAVAVKFDLAGREYQGRYFVNLNAWRVDADNGAASGGDDYPPADMADEADFEEDNVPF